MKKVQAEKIENGMTLAKDVSATSGNVLLNKGTALTPALGRRLKNWGIYFVYVEGEEESEVNDTESDHNPEELRNELSTKFSDVIENPIMKTIFDAVLEFRSTHKSH